MSEDERLIIEAHALLDRIEATIRRIVAGILEGMADERRRRD